MAHLHYQVMIACHEKLVTGLKQGADSLADALTLPESLREDIHTEKNHVEKARQLVGFLKDMIKHYPSKFNDFMSILREKSYLYPQFSSLIKQLEDKKAELLQEGEYINLNDTAIGVFKHIFILHSSTRKEWVEPNN